MAVLVPIFFGSGGGSGSGSITGGLNDLDDVVINNPQQNQVIKYNGFIWTNQTQSDSNVISISSQVQSLSANLYYEQVERINSDNFLQHQINELASGYRLVFCEEFVGDGVSTTFQLSGAILNAEIISGGWNVSNIQNSLPVNITNVEGKSIYDANILYLFTRHRISIQSLNSNGTGTLNYPPQLNEHFKIWYWYHLPETDRVDNYYRDDFVAKMEETDGQLSTAIAVDTSTFTTVLSSSDINSQLAFNRIDKHKHDDLYTSKIETTNVSSNLQIQINVISGLDSNQASQIIQLSGNSISKSNQISELSGTNIFQTDQIISLSGTVLNVPYSIANSISGFITKAETASISSGLTTSLNNKVSKSGDIMSGTLTFSNGDLNNLSFGFAGSSGMMGFYAVSSDIMAVVSNHHEHIYVYHGGVQIGGISGADPGEDVLQVGGVGSLLPPLPNVKIKIVDNVNSYVQNDIQNLSNGSDASSDWVATNDTGDDYSNWIDMGINGSAFNSVLWTINGANDGYVYTGGTNIAIGTAGLDKHLSLFAGGTLASHEAVRVHPSDGLNTGGVQIGGVYGPAPGKGILQLGGDGSVLPPLAGLKFTVVDNIDTYIQTNIQNLSPGAFASSDYVATNDRGTDAAYFVDMGINGSGFELPTWTINGKNDAYVYSGITNLAVGTGGTTAHLSLFAGGTLSENEAVRVFPDTGVKFGGNYETSPGSGNVQISNLSGTDRAIVIHDSNGILKNSEIVVDDLAQITTIASISSGLNSSINNIISLNSNQASQITEISGNLNNNTALDANQSIQIAELSGRPIADIFKIEVAAISSGLNTKIINLDATDISYTPSVSAYWYITNPPSGIKQALDNVADNAYFARHEANRLAATGLSYGGDLVSTTGPASGYTFSISGGRGLVVDQTLIDINDPLHSNPTIYDVKWNDIPNISVTQYITAGYAATYVLIDKTGNYVLTTDDPGSVEIRDNIFLGKVSHRFGVINSIRSYKRTPIENYAQITDISNVLGSLNLNGNEYSPASNDLTLKKSSGSSFRFSSNAQSNEKSPHITTDPSISLVSFRSAYRANVEGTTVLYSGANTSIHPAQWDNGSGILQTISGGNWTVKRIYFFPVTNSTYIFYGQAVYTTLAAAKDGIAAEPFRLADNSFNSATFRTWLIVRDDATDLTDSSKAVFINAGKFGGAAGGGGGITTSTYKDSEFAIYDDAIPSNILKFNLDSINSSGKTITISAQTLLSDLNILLPGSNGTLALDSTVTNISSSLQSQIYSISAALSVISGSDLSSYATNTSVSNLTGSLQSQINIVVALNSNQASQITEISASYSSLSDTYAASANALSQATTLVNINSALDANQAIQIAALSGRPISDIFRAEVAAISSGLNTRILSITGGGASDITRSEVSAISAGLQSQIYAITGGGAPIVVNSSLIQIAGSLITDRKDSKIFGYDENNNLVGITGSIGYKTFQYNINGDLISISGYGYYQTKSFTYDINGNLVSVGVI